MLFDTHLHFYPEDDIPAILDRARQSGVDKFAVIGADFEASRRAAALAAPEAGIFAVAGQHPHSAKDFSAEQLPVYRLLLNTPGMVAVGEIGLDYHYDFSPRHTQREVFITFLRLARELELPPVIHCREAAADCLSILKDEWCAGLPFIIHSFTETPEWAGEVLALGAYIAFNGIITFKNADKVRAAFLSVPRDRLLLETDSPYLAPVPYRGKRNEPAYLTDIARHAAWLLKLPLEKLAAITTANAECIFKIS